MSDRVTLAFPFGTIHPDFLLSTLLVKDYDSQTSGFLSHPDWLLPIRTTDIAQGRNRIVRAFLAGSADWLWFLDTDQSVPPETLERMVGSADADERPILSALVMAERGQGMPISPACVGIDDRARPRAYSTIPQVQHWTVGCAGSGCVLIHRKVLEVMGEKYAEDPWPWFKYSPWMRENDDGTTTPDVLGEDYTFAIRALNLGFPSTVDTTIEAGHVKERTLTSADFWAQLPPSERPRRTFAVVPVKDQFALTSEIVRQLRGQKVDGIIVVDNGSGKKTRNWLGSQDDIVLIDAPDVGIHVMWNLGIEAASRLGPFVDVLFVNNDVTLGDGCVEKLSEWFQRTSGVAVLCPNYDERYKYTTAYEGELEYRSDICADRYDGTGGIAGFCFMVRSEFLARYRFPTECKWWFGDNDLLLAVQRTGLKSAIVLDASCEHIDGGGKTGDWESPEMRAQIAADRDAFMARWAPQSAGGGDVRSGTVPPPAEPIEVER